jgi:hypothetical protein
MSVILKAIQDNFGVDEEFNAWDIHKITEINFKVVQMNLKKMHNKEVLHYNHRWGIYKLWSDEQIIERRRKVNDDIEKYGLKQKKYKL